MGLLKPVGFVAGALALAVGGAAAWLYGARPIVRAPSTETVERTPERLARGTYLVEHLMPCIGCHSEHDRTLFDMPVVNGTASGGFRFTRTLGIPGEIQPPNITPDVETGIGSWTDGEIVRAVREGIGKRDQALFPMMPYGDFRAMSDEDVRSVIVYLRSLPPVKKHVERSVVDFPVSAFVRMAPAPVTGPVATPDDARDHLGYGAYLVRMAGCKSCHTAIDGHGQSVAGREFAGGREFALTWEDGKLGPRVVTANITPDPETGYFGHATKAEWIARVRAFASMKERPRTPLGMNTLMPWVAFSGLTDQDLAAIYDYMKTVPPVNARVNSFPDAAGAK